MNVRQALKDPSSSAANFPFYTKSPLFSFAFVGLLTVKKPELLIFGTYIPYLICYTELEAKPPYKVNEAGEKASEGYGEEVTGISGRLRCRWAMPTSPCSPSPRSHHSLPSEDACLGNKITWEGHRPKC